VVANRDLADRDAIRYCPVAIQPYVEKRIELRITVVGDRVFPVEIHSQWTNHTRRDWRRGDYHHARYAVHDLPRRLARRSIALVKRLGLTFGAIDMILTPDGRYVFLEVNPDGDWLWMERTTGVPIGSAIADLLLAREGKGRRRRVFADPPPPPAAPAEPSAAVLRLPLASSPRAPRGIPPAVDRAIAATLRYLVGAARAGLPPVDAAERFGRLAKRHGTTDPRLVWEIDGALGGVHYDVLLRLAGAGTLSLAFSPEDGVPWALRHAHHARESDLVRVNGRTLNMQTVMGYLDGIWNDAALVERLVDGCLVREAVDAHGIDASADEVRSAVRGFRRERGLRSRRALAAWLRRRGWTPHDLEHESRRQVIATKLRAAIAAGRIRAYFEQHRPELDTATIVRVTADRHAAIAIARQSRAGECGFSRAVAAALEAGEAAAARTERVYRRDLPPKHARAIFRARPGAVIGPLAAAEGYDVVRVLRITAARLDPPTSDVIAEIVFDEWLEARRAEATVEWFWGDAERAPPRTRMPGASR
jgi:putative peptide maturation system protein